jgi:hypothetical protein
MTIGLQEVLAPGVMRFIDEQQVERPRLEEL